MPNLKVLIIGASIAGPTAAYWLSKAGADITVIERFPSLRTNGQNVDIRTSSVTIMCKMPGMETKTSQMEVINFCPCRRQYICEYKTNWKPRATVFVSEYQILRGDLSQILFDLTKDNKSIKYVFGAQVASMRQQIDGKVNGPITVEFANGLATTEYDLVIACDGATSLTRAMGLGCGSGDYVYPWYPSAMR